MKNEIQQYKKYPALINLFDMLKDNKNASAFVYSCVHEYNEMINQIKTLHNMQPQKRYFLVDLLRKHFEGQLVFCIKLNDVQKDHLKNYYRAKSREFLKKYTPIKTTEWKRHRNSVNIFNKVLNKKMGKI